MDAPSAPVGTVTITLREDGGLTIARAGLSCEQATAVVFRAYQREVYAAELEWHTAYLRKQDEMEGGE